MMYGICRGKRPRCSAGAATALVSACMGTVCYVDDLIRNPRERLHTKDADQGRQRTSRLDAPPTRDARIFATRHQALIQPLTYRFHTARIRGASKEAHPDARVSSSMLRRA